MNHTAIILPNQLFQQIDFYKKTNIYLVEEYLYFKQYNFHKQKLAFHRASMKYYEAYLKDQGFSVTYIESGDELSDIRELAKHINKSDTDEVHLFNPVDGWLQQRLQTIEKDIKWYNNPLFINSKEDLESYFKKDRKNYHQTNFYKQQRKERNILITSGEPDGGKWTYDTENRKKYPKNKKPPYIQFPDSTDYYQEAITYIEDNFKNNLGELSSSPLYPVTHKQATSWYNDFLENRFSGFGTYEDSIVANENILHHSVISPLINVGLLDIEEAIRQALSYAKNNDIDLNNIEGFIRQLIGWREFIRGLYEKIGVQQRTSNFWKHKRKIPASFYEGTTGITPIDTTIKKLLKTGYVHHIERLMVLANFMNLCEFDPNEVYQWFMELFIDAYDWVMVPNVYGMSLYADGGLMSTKPYISGSNYLKKMSNYENGDWQATWDGLFWNFIDKHYDYFTENPRLKLIAGNWNRMKKETKEDHLKVAQKFLDNL
ncbi:cryptochrome/photolyase family protein [Neptunitalea lumnitzerae]|uniref:Cryptochrome/photolyase family protein n=1 Tax=Neptunitalea lumnitzerae TaxID=2965509 RepID=A0ABQ5MIK0_9FLAO|nr:cryptochrome/photolyase family protein [Neptunitalea sp. Y10]GLB48762.1 cryptochrome/photolyase family protein [Neptunitalea sp. Y10]